MSIPSHTSFAAAGTLLAALALAGQASAATTEASIREGTFGREPVTGRVLFVDDKSSLFASKSNEMAIALSDGRFVVEEHSSGGRARADDGCRELSSVRVSCSASGAVAIVVDVESGADRVTITAPTRAIVSAGANDDTINAGPGSSELDGGDGRDRLFGGAGPDLILGGDDDDSLDGDGGLAPTPSNDRLAGGDGNDTLNGDVGDDRLDGGRGADFLVGANGFDTVTYSDRTTPVSVTVPDAVADDRADDGGTEDGPAGARDRIGTTVERVVGGAGGDELIGSIRPDQLEGAGGNDRLDGRDGDDLLEGGPGTDSISGETDDDTLDGGTGPDLLSGGSGIDTLTYAGRFESVSVTLPDIDSLAGSNLDDGIGGRDHPAGVEVVVGGRGADRLETRITGAELRGGPGDDTLLGGADSVLGQDVLDGGDGADRLDGRGGADTLRGGGNADLLLAADGEQDRSVDCGTDSDRRAAELDRAALDLTDPAPLGCEIVERAPSDQHPTVRIASRLVRVGATGQLRLALHCPDATPGEACRGRLTLLAAGRRILALRRYALRAGQRTSVHLRLGRGLARRLRALTAVASERGPDGRAKTTTRRLPIRR